MDIIIGSTESIGSQNVGGMEPGGRTIEAKALSSRPARKRLCRPPRGQPERRTSGSGNDPNGAGVLTLLIPEGYKIPRDIASGKYKIVLRLSPLARRS
ncbi:MAG: hypothetical protein AB2L11_12945 [Syntrophobacteraceae bacterium]